MEEKIEVTGRRGRRRTQILDVLKDRRGYCKLRAETIDRSLRRSRCGRGCGHFVKRPAEL